MNSTLKVFQSVTAVNILCNSTRPTTHLTTGQVGGGDRRLSHPQEACTACRVEESPLFHHTECLLFRVRRGERMISISFFIRKKKCILLMRAKLLLPHKRGLCLIPGSAVQGEAEESLTMIFLQVCLLSPTSKSHL